VLHPPRQYRRGFSLIEVIMVVLVLAIAAAIVVPAAGQSAAANLRVAGQLLAADLTYARSAAIAHGTDPRMVVFTPDKNQYHVAAQSAPDQPVDAPHTSQPYTVQFGKGRARQMEQVNLDSTNLQNDQLKFDLYGGTERTADDGDAQITLTCAGRTMTVTVDHATGEVTLGDIQ
jgi:prepilin-type N-terminal cleavage/methylation domain-containing protein